jgi:hypothetical protein
MRQLRSNSWKLSQKNSQKSKLVLRKYIPDRPLCRVQGQVQRKCHQLSKSSETMRIHEKKLSMGEGILPLAALRRQLHHIIRHILTRAQQNHPDTIINASLLMRSPNKGASILINPVIPRTQSTDIPLSQQQSNCCARRTNHQPR